MGKAMNTFWFGVLFVAVTSLPLAIIVSIADAIAGEALVGILTLLYMLFLFGMIFVGWKETALAQRFGVIRSFIGFILAHLIPPMIAVLPFLYIYLIGKAAEKFYRDRKDQSSAARVPAQSWSSAQPWVSDLAVAQEFRDLFTQYTFEAADEQFKTGCPVSPEAIVNRAGAVLMRKYNLSAQEVARIVEKHVAILR